MTSKHTPGPWFEKCYTDGRGIFVHGGPQKPLKHIADIVEEDRNLAENISNASLIAAAPELLGVLEFVMTPTFDSGAHSDSEHLAKARRKARAILEKVKS